jgi:GH15 family glucan-1,4-alpha-glucosidase
VTTPLDSHATHGEGTVRLNRISDYAVLGDCHSLALVGIDGSIDWACFPRFDSPSVFAKVLDASRGGHFRLAPTQVAVRTSRAYLRDTNVLVTTFETNGGVLELTDCMVTTGDAAEPTGVHEHHAIVRKVAVTQGRVSVALDLAPRFEYATVTPRVVRLAADRAAIVGGPDALWLRSTHPLHVDDTAINAVWELGAGEEAWIESAWTPSHKHPKWDDEATIDALPRRLAETVAWWRAWMERCVYDGLHPDAVRRSALALKALTYAPTGAVVAAGTTSLPEAVGGSRNWDYRYTWIRDATLTITSLTLLGFEEEAASFKGWLERTSAGRPADLQIMYGIAGERLLPEITLDHLDGHLRSRPVRIGNAAAGQVQLDSYGQILESAWLFSKLGGQLSPANWKFLAGLADLVAQEWPKPDHGIWEIRDAPRQFVHSKVNCWVALDRAVQLAEQRKLPGAIETWKREREALRDYLLTEGAPHGWFRQAVGFDAADAATLFVPALGFLPTTDPRVLRTIEVVQRDLGVDGLVHRYHQPDGLDDDEGAFLLCSFWLLDCLTHAGRLDEAQRLLERLLGLANDVGLYAEEVDPRTGEQLGNTPQAFTHMALVASCSHLSAALDGGIDYDAARDYTELAAERMLAARGKVHAHTETHGIPRHTPE